MNAAAFCFRSGKALITRLENKLPSVRRPVCLCFGKQKKAFAFSKEDESPKLPRYHFQLHNPVPLCHVLPQAQHASLLTARFRPSLLLFGRPLRGQFKPSPAAAFQPMAALCERSETLLLPILAFDWMKLFFFQDTSKEWSCQEISCKKKPLVN